MINDATRATLFSYSRGIRVTYQSYLNVKLYSNKNPGKTLKRIVLSYRTWGGSFVVFTGQCMKCKFYYFYYVRNKVMPTNHSQIKNSTFGILYFRTMRRANRKLHFAQVYCYMVQSWKLISWKDADDRIDIFRYLLRQC